MSQIELRLPNLTEGDPESQLRQLRSYLYQLTEQLQVALGNREDTAAPPDTRGLLREAVALSAKRGDGRYVGQETLERPWRQQIGAVEALEEQVERLTRRKEAPERQEAALCRADGLGIRTQEGEQVRFAPLPPFVRTADGHWQIL